MNILFVTLIDFSSIYENGIYSDLMREFMNNHHKLYIISPTEKKIQDNLTIYDDDNCKIIKPYIGATQKTNIIKKGISILTLEYKIKKVIKRYLNTVKFDLVIYSTPPITFQNAIKYVKNRDNAKTYLLLKDIFPQNAIDLKMLSKINPIYWYFRIKEKKLYKYSNYIGCMSNANVKYILHHNPILKSKIVEVCPNSIELHDNLTTNDKILIDTRKKYHIPLDKIVLIYGGNLGKPQGVDFIIECLKANFSNNLVHFMIVGSGTEYPKLQKYIDNEKPRNTQLISQLPKIEYEKLVCCCDVGLIFLNNRFTIPNFPSRILSYMQKSLPILAVTDINTDLKKSIF